MHVGVLSLKYEMMFNEKHLPWMEYKMNGTNVLVHKSYYNPTSFKIQV